MTTEVVHATFALQVLFEEQIYIKFPSSSAVLYYSPFSNLHSVMLVQTHKTWSHVQNTHEDIFYLIWKSIPPDLSSKSSLRLCKRNPFKLNSLIQGFWKDTITSYTGQIELSLLFTYKHKCTYIENIRYKLQHALFDVQEPIWFVLTWYEKICLSFHKSQ